MSARAGETGARRSSRYITKFASPPPAGDELTPKQKDQARRAERFAKQEAARELLPTSRLKICYRYATAIPGETPRVDVLLNLESGKAHYHGLMTCGSVWTCPVCAPKITQRRLEELKTGVGRWPGSVFMATFTLQHELDDKLTALVEDVRKAYRAIKSGAKWKRFVAKYQIGGSIAGLECTVSRLNGWHPHLHVLFFSRMAPGAVIPELIEEELYRWFQAALQKSGRYASKDHGVRVERAVDAQSEGDQALKKYVSKWGLEEELAKSPVKKARSENGIRHYSPFELLDVYEEGKFTQEAGLAGGNWDQLVSDGRWAAAKFQEYGQAMKGKQQLVWSKGFRAALGLNEEEKTDEELAQEEIEPADIPFVSLDPAAYRLKIAARRLRSYLLNLVETGNTERVSEFLQSLGMRLALGGIWSIGELEFMYQAEDSAIGQQEALRGVSTG